MVIGGALALTLGVALPGGQASASGHQALATAAGGALPAGHSWTVRLVTGDVVHVRTVAGRPPMVAVQPGPGRKHVMFSTYTSSAGLIEVVPGDAMATVNPARFDVTALIRGSQLPAARPAAQTFPLTLKATALADWADRVGGSTGRVACGMLGAGCANKCVLPMKAGYRYMHQPGERVTACGGPR
jgi:hypothetical protein